jgi:hypothetical protein
MGAPSHRRSTSDLQICKKLIRLTTFAGVLKHLYAWTPKCRPHGIPAGKGGALALLGPLLMMALSGLFERAGLSLALAVRDIRCHTENETSFRFACLALSTARAAL